MSLLADLARDLDEVAFARQLGVEPDETQAVVLRSSTDRIAVLAHRQWGKSTVSAAKALHRALYSPGSLVMLVSPSQRQSAELFKKLLVGYRALGRPVNPEAENRLSLELETGSRVVSLPGSESTIRGFSSVSMVIADEASRIPDDLLTGVLPSLSVSGGQLVAISTPGPRHTWFHRIWEDEDGAGWERHRIPASASGRIDDVELERQRLILGDWKYEIEFELSWAGDDDTLWRADLISQAFKTEGLPPVDWRSRA